MRTTLSRSCPFVSTHRLVAVQPLYDYLRSSSPSIHVFYEDIVSRTNRRIVHTRQNKLALAHILKFTCTRLVGRRAPRWSWSLPGPPIFHFTRYDQSDESSFLAVMFFLVQASVYIHPFLQGFGIRLIPIVLMIYLGL
jgi:hypothetical protein